MIQHPNPPGRPWSGLISADIPGKTPHVDPSIFGAGFSPKDISGLAAWYDVSAVENSGNCVKYSEQFDQSGAVLWLRTRLAAFGSVDTGAAGAGSFANTARVVDPLGSYTADFLQEDNTAANTHFIQGQLVVPDLTGSYRVTIYINDTGGRTRGDVYLVFGAQYGVIFNLTAGSVSDTTAGGGSIISKSITSVGSGWHRIDFSGTGTFTGQPYIVIRLYDNSGNASYNGDNTSGLYLWGASVRLSTWEDRYVPTGANPIFPNAQADSTGAVVNLRDLSAIGDRTDGRGNLLLQSQDFQTTWSRAQINAFGAGSVADATAAPDGTTTADFIQEDATAAAQHYISQNITDTITGGRTLSVYAKYVDRRWIALQVYNGASSLRGFFDIQNGVAGSVSGGVTSSIVGVGNGWYLCSISLTYTVSNTSLTSYIFLSTADGSTTYNGTGTNGVYLWGASLRKSSWPNDYVPTASVAILPFRESSFRDLYQGTGSAQPLLSRTDQKGNYLLQSQTFNTSWTRFNINAFGSGSVVDAAAAPDGTMTADFIQEDSTAANSHALYAAAGTGSAVSGILSAGSYAYSVWAKRNGRNWILLRIEVGASTVSCYFDLLNGIIGTASSTGTATGATGSIESSGNDWYRCTVRGTFSAQGASVIYIYLAESDGDPIFNGDNTSGIYIWGASLRKADWNDDYIATTTVPIFPGLNGKPVLWFNGTSHFLKTPSFSLRQPEMVYMVLRQESWTSSDRIMDGGSNDSFSLFQSGVSPLAYTYSGGPGTPGPLGQSIGVFNVVSLIFDTASSILQTSINSPVTGNPGVSNANGFTLAALSSGVANWGNISVAEVLIYETAHDGPTRLRIQQYLARKWGLTL